MYKNYQCQKCGETIGWLGHFIEYITFDIISHNCSKSAVDTIIEPSKLYFDHIEEMVTKSKPYSETEKK